MVVNVSWTRTQYSEALRRRFYDCGRNLRATYGTFFQGRNSSFFGVGQQLLKAFYGTSYVLESAKGGPPVMRGYLGELVWTYQGTRTAPGTFRRAMLNLAKETGFGAPLVFAVPASVTQALPTTSLTVRAQFGTRQVLHLMQRNGDPARGQLRELARGLARDYLAAALDSSPVGEELKPRSAD